MAFLEPERLHRARAVKNRAQHQHGEKCQGCAGVYESLLRVAVVEAVPTYHSEKQRDGRANFPAQTDAAPFELPELPAVFLVDLVNVLLVDQAGLKDVGVSGPLELPVADGSKQRRR